MKMSGMTKEALRSALVGHGVEAPPLMTTKKEEFVALYQEHIAPVDSGDFSSDEETDKTSSPRRSPRKSDSKIELNEINTTDDVMDVKALDDDGLFQHLKKHGIDVGPIVASTRSFYEKKLALVLSGDSGMNGDSNEFSANEDEDEEEEQFDKLELRSRTVTETLSPVEDLGQDKEEEEKFDTLELRNRSVTETLSKLEDLGQDGDEVLTEKRVTRSKVSSTNSSSVATPPDSGLRQRMTTVDQLDTGKNYDWDLSPSPRPSIHSYTVSNTSKSFLQTEKVTSSERTRKLLSTMETSEFEEPLVMKRKGGRMLTLIKLMLVLAAVGLVVYLVVTGQEETGGVVSPDMVEEAVNSAQGNKGE